MISWNGLEWFEIISCFLSIKLLYFLVVCMSVCMSVTSGDFCVEE